MERANVVDLRRACEVVEAGKKAGILFVPVPVLYPDDGRDLLQKMNKRLSVMLQEATMLEAELKQGV